MKVWGWKIQLVKGRIGEGKKRTIGWQFLGGNVEDVEGDFRVSKEEKEISKVWFVLC